MNLSMFGVRALVLLIVMWYVVPQGIAQEEGPRILKPGTVLNETSGSSGTRSTIPLEGRINALVVFVQLKEDVYEHCVDTEGVPLYEKPPEVSYGATTCGATPGEDGPRYESWTDDPVTEWPASTLVGGEPVRALPQFAARLIDPPGTDPTDYTEGSLSHYYRLMSDGRFQLEGFVYPELFVPSCEAAACDGDPGTRTFSDWRVIGRQAVAYVDAHPHGIDFSKFDRYDNTTGELVPGGDDIFDMIILHFRFGPAFVDFGAANPVYDGLTLGGLRVTPKSLVFTNGINAQATVALIAHEIGHRQLGGRHSVEGKGAGAGSDRMSVMWGHDWAVMSAPDRIRLGWVTPRVVDLATFDRQRERLGDTYQTNEVLHVLRGEPGEGDLIVEVRTRTNWWDREADGVNADGDRGDFVLPQEGLYLYKRNRDGGRYSSMEHTGHPRRRFHWRPVPPFAYAPGDAYPPASAFGFRFYERDAVDQGLAITDITRDGDTFSFDVWSDYPGD